MARTATARVRVEQRHSRRRRAFIRCWVNDALARRYVRLIDVGLEGARVELALPPPVGDEVEIRFAFRPGGVVVRARGEVVWRTMGFRGRGGVMGVRFVEIDGGEVVADFLEEDELAGKTRGSPSCV